MNKEEKKVEVPVDYDSDDEEYIPKGMSDKEMDENIDFLKNHPLFMREVPKDIDKHEGLSALQNLIYDEDPKVVANGMNVFRRYIMTNMV
jgi:hypothetical protein